MIKKLPYVVALGFACCTLNLSAATESLNDAQQASNKTAFKLTKAQTQLKTRLTLLENLQADFSQKVFDNTGAEIMQGAGFLKLNRPEKLYWKQTSPDETLLVSDGTKTFYYDEFAEQVTILNSKQLIDNTPFALLTSNDDNLWHNYSVNNSENVFVITPNTDRQSQVERLELTFSDDLLTSMKVFDNTGQTSVYVFSKQQLNQPIDDAFFKFTIPADVLVDDQSQGE
ncbi:outer membrane lipoprotein chaperone LolA [Pseudoalteromonas sp. SSM20]|uniref:outer membrane lipoprotein chaperone LolA n=1 Tax=Pseudoalteromonas sp. SSM20 TaxID=3139394 RepID=UPI003BA91039